MRINSILLFISSPILLFGCGESRHKDNSMTFSGLDPTHFNTVLNGDSINLSVLRNNSGMEVCLSNYGARIISLAVPDRNGKLRNVVLGFDSISSYFPQKDLPRLGGTIGRYAGRIGKACFILDGDTIHLTANDTGNCLHGGAEDGDLGWQYKVYKIEESNDTTVLMTMDSPDGENGFPGNVKASVRFTLLPDNALRIDYGARTDQPTVICMSNQSYFNLTGNPEQSISDLRLQINASTYMPLDSTKLVTGDFLGVEGTPLDFRKEKLIGRDIDNAWNEQIRLGHGYDHAFVLDSGGDLTKCAARLHSRMSGITMELYSTEPALQFYSGNYLYSSLSRKQNKNFSQRHGLSLEPIHYPDSPNHPEWPDVILRPGERYSSTTIYKFIAD